MEESMTDMETEMGGWAMGMGGGLWMLLLAAVVVLTIFALIKYLAK